MQTSALPTRFSAIKFYASEAPEPSTYLQDYAEQTYAIGVTTKKHDQEHELIRKAVYLVVDGGKPEVQDIKPDLKEALFSGPLNQVGEILSSFFQNTPCDEIKLVKIALDKLNDISAILMDMVVAAFDYNSSAFKAMEKFDHNKLELDDDEESEPSPLENAITAKKITFDTEGGEIRFNLKA